MKDLYTFDTTPAAALETYARVKAAYTAFFDELGLPYLVADADSGDMGGDLSHEFHFATPVGEDIVISCDNSGCGYTLNEEMAEGRVEKEGDGSEGESKEGSWGKCPRCHTGKLTGQRAVELGHTFYLGTRYSLPLDCAVDLPPSSLTSPTSITPATPQRVPISMGCHGIGISRLIGATATLLRTPHGLAWPRAIAPYDVIIIAAIRGAHIASDAEALYDSLVCESVGGLDVDVLLDDREEVGVGWKLKDADLVGYPVVVVVGRGWAEGRVEVQCRRLGLREEVGREELVAYVAHALAKL